MVRRISKVKCLKIFKMNNFFGPNKLQNSSLCYGTMQFGDGANDQDWQNLVAAAVLMEVDPEDAPPRTTTPIPPSSPSGEGQSAAAGAE